MCGAGYRIGDGCEQFNGKSGLRAVNKRCADPDGRHREENEVATEQGRDKIKLGKIEVKMGEKSVSLTVEQARELSALLKGLFGDDSTRIVHVQDYIYTRPWYMGPTWTYSGSNWGVATSSNTVNATAGGEGYLTNVTFTLKA